MQSFSLDHLNATQFEEFCYDLLKALKPDKIDWRKGTGLSSMPSRMLCKGVQETRKQDASNDGRVVRYAR